MATLKPIQTRAYGSLFRSRLEARWAVFFTSLGLTWEYEPEGFDLDGELYLPDFRVWTPQGKPIWYEVKPAHIAEDGKLKKFAKALEEQALKTQKEEGGYQPVRSGLLNGDPRHFFATHILCPRCGHSLPSGNQDHWGSGCVNILCHDCDYETPCGSGHPQESDGLAGMPYVPHKGWIMVVSSVYNQIDRLVTTSSNKSLSARFEHGEAPR